MLNKEDAEDAVIETFLRIIENREKFSNIPGERKPAYAKTILKHISLDMIRKRNHHAIEELTDDTLNGNLSVEEIAEGNVLFERLVEYIKSMSEALQQVLYLRLNYNFTSKQIAETLGISVDATKKRLSNAQKQIKQFVEEVHCDERNYHKSLE